MYKIRFRRDYFETCNIEQREKAFLLTSNFVHKGLSVPALGLYTCIKSFKMCLESYFKENVLKLATSGQNDKGFLLTSIFVPKGLSAPALGLYSCIKALNIYQDQVLGKRLQYHWSSGLTIPHQSCFSLYKCRIGEVIFTRRCFHDVKRLWCILR